MTFNVLVRVSNRMISRIEQLRIVFIELGLCVRANRCDAVILSDLIEVCKNFPQAILPFDNAGKC